VVQRTYPRSRCGIHALSLFGLNRRFFIINSYDTLLSYLLGTNLTTEKKWLKQLLWQQSAQHLTILQLFWLYTVLA
jgi:hypothetical protein